MKYDLKGVFPTEKISLYNCDCMELLRQTPDNYYSLAIIDPPYGINLDGGQIGYSKHIKKNWDSESPPIEYFKELFRVSQNQIIWGFNHFLNKLPNTKGKDLVADVSSCFLSEPMDVTKYGMVYGGVQKNVGPAGTQIVIIRDDLIRDDVLPCTPTMMKYKTHADKGSLYNTPPCYGIYICGKVFKWLLSLGGLEEMQKINENKAKILYDYLDESKLFHGTVRKEDRSLMNVPFITGDEEKDAEFIKAATAAGFVSLKGHRSVGGMRASIYNAMPTEGVEKLVAFMKEYEAKNI